MTSATAQDKKKEGNDAFSAKDFARSAELYSEAIELDPTQHVFYSNRSAAYAAMGEYTKAEQDARKCIEMAPDFTKGYHRLANALKNQNRNDEAQEALAQGRQISRQAAAKSQGGAASRQAPSASGGLPPRIAKELQELQPQFQATLRELEEVTHRISMLQKEQKRIAFTERDLSSMPEGTNMYRSVGKLFLQSPKEETTELLSTQQKSIEKDVEASKARQEYLQRQKDSMEANIKELIASGKQGAGSN